MIKPIGIFGGSFDPIHLGHIKVAIEAYNQLDLQAIKFIPCYQSPHKKMPYASGEHRVNMLKLALQNYPQFPIDERELNRQGISYMFDTLTELRAELPHTPLCLIMSIDAFNKFPSWHNWQEIIGLVHIIVANRNMAILKNSKLEKFIEKHQTLQSKNLKTKISGYIYFLHIEPKPISATDIRKKIACRENIVNLVSKKVAAYIEQNKLYS